MQAHELTAEDIEDQGGCLASAGFVGASKSDGLPSLHDLIVVLLEVRKQLARPLIQGKGI